MKPFILALALTFITSSAQAQHAHQSSSPIETGQSQFAAIAEIVALLRDDPETDWAQIDIAALRAHLVDMDNVTTKASVTRSVEELSVTITVTADGEPAQSIQRMVLAHSPMLQEATGWSVLAKQEIGGASMEVRVSSETELEMVAGLGFFGLMTVGAHHQQHHLMIASGGSPH